MRCCSRTIWNNFHTELRSRVTLQFSGQSDDEVEVDYSKNCVVGWRIEINLSVLGGTRLCRKLHSRPHYYNHGPHMAPLVSTIYHHHLPSPSTISLSCCCLLQSFRSLLFVWSPLCCEKIDYFTFVRCCKNKTRQYSQSHTHQIQHVSCLSPL